MGQRIAEESSATTTTTTIAQQQQQRQQGFWCCGMPEYTMEEIRQHQSTESAWLVAGGYVYDVTAYLSTHPGGQRSILKKCGGVCDCTQDLHFHSHEGQRLWKKYRIGRVKKEGDGCDKDWWMFWKN